MPAATIAEAIADAKDGIGDYLTTTAGLRAADGITIRTATIAPEEFQQEMVILGDVTAPQGRPGLRGRSATPTMTCWVVITRPGGDETAIRGARARATALMALIEGALAADPSAASTVQPPGGLQVSSGGLEESPVAWEEQAARRATIPFTLSWTSHVA